MHLYHGREALHSLEKVIQEFAQNETFGKLFIQKWLSVAKGVASDKVKIEILRWSCLFILGIKTVDAYEAEIKDIINSQALLLNQISIFNNKRAVSSCFQLFKKSLQSKVEFK